MWLFTKLGFYSCGTVSETDNRVQVRARDRKHLENLQGLCQQLRDVRIIDTRDRDYEYRMVLTREQFRGMTEVLSDLVQEPKVKPAILDHLGDAWFRAMNRVWSVLYAQFGAKTRAQDRYINEGCNPSRKQLEELLG